MFEDLKPHIADLRKRLVISTITVVVMFFVCFSYYEPILNWMMVPVEASLPKNSQMVAVEIQETFFTALQVAFFAGFIGCKVKIVDMTINNIEWSFLF
jgi:sec-independent protein translocase protein TatC